MKISNIVEYAFLMLVGMFLYDLDFTSDCAKTGITNSLFGDTYKCEKVEK